ncbi:MAG: DUF4097 family beta strand repeat protein [Lachnospiraceae bacterium]|nr:DUF4097 family beta strand repeat protein [Lachnospiraceae bacterium]
MKNAKQIVFIVIGAAMILLAVGLICLKKSDDTVKGFNGEKQSGSYVFSEPIKSLVFEAGACTIEILEGEEAHYIVDFENLKYGTLVTEQEGEELKISYKQNNNWTAKMFMEDDINDQKITLTMPKDAELDSALFEFGAAEISMEDVTAKKLYLTVGAGELNADALTATELARFNVGAGVFYAKDVTLTDAELVCGVGEMNVGGTFNGDTTADCGVGAMELRVHGEQEEYRGELNCGLGEIEFGNINIEGSGKQNHGTSSAERRMDIKCGIGEVDVHFYK